MEIFAKATRAKLRFDSPVGLLTVEQLWDLRLTGGTKTDLNRIAQSVNAELKACGADNFVDAAPDPKKTELELKLEVLKAVIAVKISERDAAAKAAERREKKRKIAEALANREVADLQGKSTDELKAELQALED